jgi:hypothetical protein
VVEREFGEDDSAESNLSVSADCKRALAIGKGNVLRLWDVEGEKEIAAFITAKSGFGGIALAPDGKSIFCSQKNEPPRLLEIAK